MSDSGDILVLGLGRSGSAAARYAAKLVDRREARSVTAIDSGDTEALRALAADLAHSGVRVVLGTDTVTGRFDLCVSSPGIPPRARVAVAARAASARMISEIEFAYEQSSVPWIAVTGTNGKTTTTALTCHLLRSAGIGALAVGNIGPVAITAIEDPDAEVLVAEVSSFQLALTDRFHPRVAVLLNLTPDHIDWHSSLDAYAAAKAKVFANMDVDDLAIVDVDDPGSAPFAEDVARRGVPVSRVSLTSRLAGGATLVSGVLTLETAGGPVHLIRADELAIRGAHNVSNALAAAAAAHAMGASPAYLQSGLRTFTPIEHRLEPVAEHAGISWYNDSKATNPDAALKALKAFDAQPIVILLGGRNKENSFTDLAREVAERARAAVLFGEARTELAAAFSGLPVRAVEAVGLEDAIERASALAERGDVVLLSPACASFDEFTSYEQRGEFFRESVRGRLGVDA